MTVMQLITSLNDFTNSQIVELAIKEKGIKNLSELADKLGMSRQTLQYQIYHRKGGVGLELLKKICEI